jgi:acyl-CoA hydrolase
LIRHGESGKIKDVEVVHIHTEGPAGYADARFVEAGVFKANCLFTGANMRKALNEGYADFTPIFLREIPQLFRKNLLPIDVALISVSPADVHGYHSMGVSVDVARSAIQSAKVIIALVNDQVPRTFGDGFVHGSHFNFVVEESIALPTRKPEPLGEVENKIGQFIADNLVDDGACLQMGIGKIPDAVLGRLHSHKNLGIHTEMLSDGILDLVDKGVITNAKKSIHPGNIVTGFAVGTQKLYDFFHENPFVRFLDIAYVNNPTVIGRNSKVTAINSLIEIDLTGQIVASTIGNRVFSGIGGQLDFQLGARFSEGGRGILAFPSLTPKGETRIVPCIKRGAAVTTSREHVDWIVTEHGYVNLFGKTLRQRAKALISIAHPTQRDALTKAAREELGLHI